MQVAIAVGLDPVAALFGIAPGKRLGFDYVPAFVQVSLS